MTIDWVATAAARTQAVEQALTRSRLVFLQLGAIFDPIRGHLLDELNAFRLRATDPFELDLRSQQRVIVDDLEHLTAQTSATTHLGGLRANVLALVDAGVQVCLVSRSPRIAYPRVPGSSLLEDAVFVAPMLLDDTDFDQFRGPSEANTWPLYHELAGERLAGVLARALPELRQDCLIALDHALFEVDPKGVTGLTFLDPDVEEALHSAGLMAHALSSDVGPASQLVGQRDLAAWRTALADALAAMTDPPAHLAVVSQELWYIEKTLRGAVRSRLVAADRKGWRASAVSGQMREEVLRRARSDSIVTATSLDELRDPLEWLNLGELLDIIRSERMANLGANGYVWTKFMEEILPLRNRVYHMRAVGRREAEIATKWSQLMRRKVLFP